MPHSKEQAINPLKTITALLIVPLELLIGAAVAKLPTSQLIKVLLSTLVFLAGFIVAISLYHDVLAAEWQIFKRRWFIKLLLAVGGVIVSYAILAGARFVLTSTGLAASTNSADLLSIQSATVGLVGSLTVLMAPFSEEIIFRHVLFYQWKNRGIFTWLMFIISSVLFGLAHWNNFDGNVIAMIPYMLVGAWYALIYFFSKNIWQNILTHFLFDVIQFLGALLVFVVALVTGQ